MNMLTADVLTPARATAELDRLGDEIAELSAHLEAATARLLDLIPEAREAATRHWSRALHVYRDDDGMVRVRGRLEPEVGELLIQALAAARETLYQRTHRTFVGVGCTPDDPADVSAETPVEDPPTFERQQANALALLAETALHHG